MKKVKKMKSMKKRGTLLVPLLFFSAFSPLFLIPRARRLFMLFLLFTALTGAAAQETLAILPFTGGQGENGETIAELFSFQRDLTALFIPVPRTSINRAIRSEQGFQMASGMTDPDTIAALGKQLGATYVVAGTIAKLGNQNLLVIAIVHTENLQQIAGDVQTYGSIEEIRGKLPAMARNIAAAVGTDTSRLPPVGLAGGADGREADALAQILAVHLIRSGRYAVYPRTKSLEQVQEEYGREFSGDTADEYLPNIGTGDNPRLVLSVTARRLGSFAMFNAAVINLETGAQEAGDRAEYRTLDDGVQAMEELALRLTGQETKAAELRARVEREHLAAGAAWARYNPAANDAASFTRAIAAINNDRTPNTTYTITLGGSFTSGPVVFTGSAAKTLTIKGDALVRTISNSGGDALFTVPKGITLILDNNVTLDGNKQKYSIVNVNGGALVTKGGSTLRGSQNRGVFVGSNGVFTMSGGAIGGNSTERSGGGTIDSTNRAERGRVAYVNILDRQRNSTAGPGVNMDSRVSGSGGGWE